MNRKKRALCADITFCFQTFVTASIIGEFQYNNV